MTGLMLLRQLQEKSLLHAVLYRHPDLHVVITAPEFDSFVDDDDNREQLIVQKLGTGWDVVTLRSVANQAGFILSFLLPSEYECQYREPRTRSVGWAGELLQTYGLRTGTQLDLPFLERPPLPVFHFYGYKGGQARSSVLGMMAKSLADDGWRVLVVDADLEAPSLDLLFDCRPVRRSCTLLGASLGDEIEPLAVYRPVRSDFQRGEGGKIDLLACRPAESSFDLEALAFAARCSADPVTLERALVQIAKWAGTDSNQIASYDVLLVDQRAGLSPFVLPSMKRLPGPVVVFTRLDDQWSAAERHLESLLRVNLGHPGLFVAFQPDNEDINEYRNRNRSQIQRLLGHLADASNASSEKARLSPTRGADGEEDSEDYSDLLLADDLQDSLIIWPYDPSFRIKRLPNIDQTTGVCRQALLDLRRILELSGARHHPVESPPTRDSLSLNPSGGADQGTFIETEALRRLLANNSPVRFILGRKGTGKTRLFRELAIRGLGEALLADDQQPSEIGGLRAQDASIVKAINIFAGRNQPEGLWWLLFLVGLEQPTRVDTATLREQLDRELLSPCETNMYIERILAAAGRAGTRRQFLLDALEVALPADRSARFIEALFAVLSTLRSDDRLSKAVDFRLFLRADLALVAIQNMEQFTAGQKIDLQWDTQGIWNFALSRLAELPFFQNQFASVVTDIRRYRSRILSGNLSTEECEALFLRVFPPETSDGIKTTTFLRTYFSDNVQAKETYQRATYYPRVFDKFLEIIANPSDEFVHGKRFVEQKLKPGNQSQEDGHRINPSLMNFAHQAAAVAYLQQVRQELAFMIQLPNSASSNGVQKLLDELAGQSSPFLPADLIAHLVSKTQFNRPDVEKAMEQMRSIGMFEQVSDSSKWRVGRLFKTALRMKYLRGPKKTGL